MGGAEPGQRRRLRNRSPGQGSSRGWTSGPGPSCRCCPRCCAPSGSSAEDAEERISTARDTQAGDVFSVAGQQFQRCRQGPSGRVYVTETSTGKRRNLTHEDEAAFWSWATVEVLRATGIRIEEMLELAHHKLHRLRTAGHWRDRADAAGRPSKTDAERLLLVSPELTEVLTAIIFRVRPGTPHCRWCRPTTCSSRPGARRCRSCSGAGTVLKTAPSTAATSASAWSRPPRPHRSPSPASRWYGGPMTSGESSSPTPCGPACRRTSPRKSAVTPCWTPPWATPRSTPENVVAHHRAFIAHRRAERPSEEYRDLTDGEWDEFLAHFELPESRARHLRP